MALQTRDEAMTMATQAIHLVKDVRVKALKAEDALNVEKVERTRLSEELAFITEYVGRLLNVLP